MKKTMLVDLDYVICHPGFLKIVNDFLGTNYVEDDFEYFFSIIPDEYLKKISLFSIAFENSKKDSEAILRKYQLEAEIYRYISYLYYDNKMH